MAKKPTDKQLFKMKNEWLEQFYEEVKPRDFTELSSQRAVLRERDTQKMRSAMGFSQ